MPDDEIIICLMKNMHPSYKTFLNSLQRQLNLTLQSFILNLIQEKTLVKDMNQTMIIH
jgi:uncharacterized protein YjaG (DUF416 family)